MGSRIERSVFVTSCLVLAGVAAGAIGLARLGGAGVPGLLVSLALVAGGAFLLVLLQRPLLRRLEESERQSSALFESAPDAIILTDETRHIARVNEQAEYLYGFQREEMLGQHISLLVPHRFRELLSSMDLSAVRKGGRLGRGLELFGLRADGREVPVEINLAPLAEPRAGEDVPVASIVRDVTVRRRMEEQLRESEERFRRVVEGLQHEYIFATLDAQGNVTYVSPSVENILGYAPEEVSGDFRRLLTDSPMNEAVAPNVARSLAGELVPASDAEFRHKDGSVRILEALDRPIRDASGNVVGVDTIAHDVTRVRRYERELELARQSAEATSEKMRRDLEAAARVQSALLPNELPRLPGIGIAWEFRPCSALAGDALNVFALDEHHLCAYVIDVSGHGVPAALLSFAVTRSLAVRGDSTSIVTDPGDAHRIASPARVAARLNRLFPMQPPSSQYFTLLYGVLDVRTGRFEYVSPGQPGPILVRPGEAPRSHDAPAVPIGMFPESEYETHQLDLAPGDRLYLHSDGIHEQRSGGDGQEWGMERMREALAGAQDGSLEESTTGLMAELDAWRGPDACRDDVSLLALERSR